jgi:hypothetical protein
MCPLQNLAGVDVDDPVAPRPAASIGDATISSVGHRPSSIVAPNRRPEPRPTISLNRKRRCRPAPQHHTAGARRSSSSIAVIAANNFAKSKTPAPASVAAPHRRRAQVEQLDPL